MTSIGGMRKRTKTNSRPTLRERGFVGECPGERHFPHPPHKPVTLAVGRYPAQQKKGETMENKIIGYPRYWKRMEENAKQNKLPRAASYWKGLLTAQQYVQRTAIAAGGLGLFVGFILGLLVGLR